MTPNKTAMQGNEPILKNLKTMMHISMAREHSSMKEGVLVWPGNENDGKILCIESHTPKYKNGNFGKAKTSFYLKGKDTPMFKTIKEFIAHYTQTFQ